VGEGVIPELNDAGVALQCLLHDSTLDPATSAVDQTDLTQSCFGGGSDVLLHDGANVARVERVQIERGFDWNPMGHVP
jgi:hypothetical protein